MKREKRLFTFKINDKGHNSLRYTVYGNYRRNRARDNRPPIIFSDTRIACRRGGGREMALNPASLGFKDSGEVAQAICLSASSGDKHFEVLNTDEGLSEILSILGMFSIEVITTLRGGSSAAVLVMKKIVGMNGLYELKLVTDRYTYYKNGESIMMLDTRKQSFISDGCLALDGYESSMKHVLEGGETLIWGRLSEEE